MSVIVVFILSLAWSINSMPLINTRYASHRFVDLTHVFEVGDKFPGGLKHFRIDQVFNETSEEWRTWYKGEIYSQNSHAGTHMDAPSHWSPTALNIDEMPVSQFYGPAAVIDITQKARLNRDAEVTIEDLLEWESGIGQSLNGTIVLIRTGWGEKYKNTAEYMGTDGDDRSEVHYPGISGAACEWLAEHRDIKGLGSDTFSPERGMTFFNYSYPCHIALLPRGIFILESVGVLKELPLYGAQVTALPQKIIRGSGAPVRIVATIPEIIHNLP